MMMLENDWVGIMLCTVCRVAIVYVCMLHVLWTTTSCGSVDVQDVVTSKSPALQCLDQDLAPIKCTYQAYIDSL